MRVGQHHYSRELRVLNLLVHVSMPGVAYNDKSSDLDTQHRYMF